MAVIVILTLSIAVLGRKSKSNFVDQPPALDGYQVYRSYDCMNQGTIATLTDKGFGFIKRDGEQKDLFFHSNSLVGVTFDELREGDAVTFDTEESPKGLNAVNVSRVS